MAGNGDVGTVTYYKGKFEAYQRTYVLHNFALIITGKYLYCMLQFGFKQHLERLRLGNTMPFVKRGMLATYEIPLPPLEIQKEIIKEIDGYQKIINGARQVVENYQPRIPASSDWSIVELSEVIQEKPKNGYSGKPVSYTTKLKVLTLTATTFGKLDPLQFKYLDEEIPLNSPCRCNFGDIYLQRGNTKDLVGTAALFDIHYTNFIYPDLMIRIRADESKILTHFLLYTLQSQPARNYLCSNAVGSAGSMPKINQAIVERIPIPLPDLTTQRAIVAQIEEEQRLVNANKELIRIFEEKIKVTINRVWGEENNVKVDADDVGGNAYQPAKSEILIAAEGEAEYSDKS